MQIPETSQKRSERAVLLKPFHAAKLFFTTEDAEITEQTESTELNRIHSETLCFILSRNPFSSTSCFP